MDAKKKEKKSAGRLLYTAPRVRNEYPAGVRQRAGVGVSAAMTSGIL